MMMRRRFLSPSGEPWRCRPPSCGRHCPCFLSLTMSVYYFKKKKNPTQSLFSLSAFMPRRRRLPSPSIFPRPPPKSIIVRFGPVKWQNLSTAPDERVDPPAIRRRRVLLLSSRSSQLSCGCLSSRLHRPSSNLLHVPSANTIFFLHFMGPPDPPGDFLQTHLLLRVAPPPFSSAPVGFINDNGTDFMRQYLTPLASSQPSTTPGPLVSFGGLSHGQRFIPSPGCSLHDVSPIYGLGGTSCIPEGSALRAPVPHDTTSTGPRRITC
jgi:hypothetical protein